MHHNYRKIIVRFLENLGKVFHHLDYKEMNIPAWFKEVSDLLSDERNILQEDPTHSRSYMGLHTTPSSIKGAPPINPLNCQFQSPPE